MIDVIAALFSGIMVEISILIWLLVDKDEIVSEQELVDFNRRGR